MEIEVFLALLYCFFAIHAHEKILGTANARRSAALPLEMIP